jgi:hypothetical protein
MKQKTIYAISSVLSFIVAGLLITGNTGLEIQPLNEAACFSVAGMMGFLLLFAAVSKDNK